MRGDSPVDVINSVNDAGEFRRPGGDLGPLLFWWHKDPQDGIDQKLAARDTISTRMNSTRAFQGAKPNFRPSPAHTPAMSRSSAGRYRPLSLMYWDIFASLDRSELAARLVLGSSAVRQRTIEHEQHLEIRAIGSDEEQIPVPVVHMRTRVKAVSGLAGLVFLLSACGGGAEEPPESPRPTVSLRGGVRGELGEAEKAERERREQERGLLDP
jgi:hypothetical protein